MRFCALIAGSVLVCALCGCASRLPGYRADALAKAQAVQLQGGDSAYPADFASIREAVSEADRFYQQGQVEQADSFYMLAIKKSELLESQLERDRKIKAETLQRAEAEKLERDRQKSLDDLRKKIAEDREREEREAKRRSERVAQQVKEREKERESRQLPLYHTVMRGETLPQIAAQADVYNDASLWPLLYRANRDQIRDPRRIWPGQVFRIPRNVSREDLVEARRYAQERMLP